MENISLFLKKNVSWVISAVTDNIGTILIPFLVILLVIYITAFILSKKTRCIIIWGWKDLIAMVLLTISLFFMINIISDDYSELHNILLPVFGILSAVFLIWTIINSIISNVVNILPANIIFIIVSILAKLILLAIIPIFIFLYLGYRKDSGYKKDGRYRDGTRGNQKTQALAIVVFVASLLIVPLIKNNND